MTEADLKRELKAALLAMMPGGFAVRHEDRFTAGVPDLSWTWNGRTTWIEIKKDTEPTAVQRAVLARLGFASGGRAIWIDYRAGRSRAKMRYGEIYDGRTGERLAELERQASWPHLEIAAYVKTWHL